MKITKRQLKRIIKEEILKLNESLLGLPHPLPDSFEGDVMLVEKAIEIAKLAGTPLPEPIETSYYDSYGKQGRTIDKYSKLHMHTGKPPRHQVRRQMSTHPLTRTMDDKRYDGNYPEDKDKYYPPGSPQLARTIFNRIVQLGRKMDPSSSNYSPREAKFARHRQQLLQFGQNALRKPERYGEDEWDDFLINWIEEFQMI
jgi:hypothetical protein